MCEHQNENPVADDLMVFRNCFSVLEERHTKEILYPPRDSEAAPLIEPLRTSERERRIKRHGVTSCLAEQAFGGVEQRGCRSASLPLWANRHSAQMALARSDDSR